MVLLQLFFHLPHLHLLLNFLLSCIALSSIFLHLVLKFFGIFIVEPILLLQLLHHGCLLLVTFACGLLLFYPVLVPDILTNLFSLVLLLDVLFLPLLLRLFLSKFSLLFLLQFFLTWRK